MLRPLRLGTRGPPRALVEARMAATAQGAVGAETRATNAQLRILLESAEPAPRREFAR